MTAKLAKARDNMLAGTEEAGTIHDQVAVKSPGLGDQRKNLLQDIARFSGGKAVREGFDLQLNNIQISDLGQAERIIIDKNKSRDDQRLGDQQRYGT